MSSSSAYNNVLLKSPVQVQAPAAPKRDFQNDYSSADFNQTFNDIQKLSRKDEKAAKHLADKKAAESRSAPEPSKKSAKDPVGKSEAKPVAKQTEKQAKESDTTHKEASTELNVGQKPLAKDKDVGRKISAGDDSKELEDASDDILIPVTVEPIATPAQVASELTALTMGAPASPELASGVATSGEVAVVAPLLSSGNNAVGDQDTSTIELVPELKPQAALQVQSEAKISLDVTATAESLALDDDDAPAVIAEAAKINPEKTLAEPTQPNITSLPVNNGLPQKNLTTPVSGELTETSEEMVGAFISDAVTSEKKILQSDKATVAQDVATDVDTQTPVPQDAKSVFEKMLQTVARGNSREESAPLNPAPNTTPSSTASVMDSLARFNDAQTPATRGFVVQTTVPVPVGQPQWSQAVGEKVLWLAAQNVSSAEINLHPKDLGPMQVKVSVNQEQTSVSFTSHHPVVREVLDQNLNRLRDMLSEQGLNLVNVDVSDKSFSRQQGDAQEQKGQAGHKGAVEEESVTAVTTIVQHRLVDHYA